jgi:hypothetical protein
MVDNRFGVSICSENEEAVPLQADQSIFMLEAPSVEEIARAIWQRQHDTLSPEAIHYNAEWRDQSLPSKFFDSFVLDAHAVLTLLYKKHIEYQKIRV